MTRPTVVRVLSAAIFAFEEPRLWVSTDAASACGGRGGAASVPCSVVGAEGEDLPVDPRGALVDGGAYPVRDVATASAGVAAIVTATPDAEQRPRNLVEHEEELVPADVSILGLVSAHKSKVYMIIMATSITSKY